MRSRSLIRTDSTAATPASAVTSTARPKAAALIGSIRLPAHRVPAVMTAGDRRLRRRSLVTFS